MRQKLSQVIGTGTAHGVVCSQLICRSLSSGCSSTSSDAISNSSRSSRNIVDVDNGNPRSTHGLNAFRFEVSYYKRNAVLSAAKNGASVSRLLCSFRESCQVRHFGSNANQQSQSMPTASTSDAVDLLTSNEDEKRILEEVQESNERYLGDIELRKVNQDQWGVFASRSYPKGSTVISSTLIANTTNDASPTKNTSSTSCSHSIQIDWDKHILMKLPAQFLNHSCDPNVVVGGGANDVGSYDFVALRDIDAGEEVRFDYETTEYEVGAFSDCHCGATNCRGEIRGYKHNGEAVLQKYGRENVADYLVEDWEGYLVKDQ